MNMKVNIAGVEWNNPVTVASGTFGSGKEYGEFVDLNKIGAITTKGVANVPWPGNPTPRIAETYGGMINAIGLQNPGIDLFCQRDIPYLQKFADTKIIVNVCGKSTEDYCEVVERLADEKVDMLEINISCPNVKQGGMAFGVQAASAAEVVAAVRKVYPKTLIVKLSPNVTDITEIARAVESAGADSVSLINTLLGMAIDSEKRRPVLSTITGGMSGPAVKPIALRMVWQVAKAVKIPVVGIGGITTGADAIEFMLAGATAIEVGTANFMNPAVTGEIVDYIEDYLVRHKMSSIDELIGALEV